jgi:PPM family protein phosphatase
VSDQQNPSEAPTFKLKACGVTDVGMRRPHNEDSIVVAPEEGLFVVADGMGGHAAGEVASLAAVQTLHNFVCMAMDDGDFTWPFGFNDKLSRNENLLHSAIMLSNHKVCMIAQDNPECSGMGTTMAALHIRLDSGEGIIAHVGDSRVYRWRKGKLEQMTRDHSWVNEQLQRNVLTEEEARNHRWRNVITRALGNRPDIEIDMQTVPLEAGDLFLLCSDGLTTMLEDRQLSRAIAQNVQNLDTLSQSLVDEANELGGFDNISVVLARVDAA